MSEHTKGRLHCKAGRAWGSIRNNSGDVIASDDNETTGKWTENARRLVAAWNACEGIPTENLELGGYLEMNRADDAYVRELRRDRDELIEALRGMVNMVIDGKHNPTGCLRSPDPCKDGHHVNTCINLLSKHAPKVPA